MDEPRRLINYVKASEYEERSCDGAFGHRTPEGKLWIGFYAERYSFPLVVELPSAAIGPTGSAAKSASEQHALQGRTEEIIRTVHSGIFMSVEAAEQFHAWLGEQLAALSGQN